MNTPGWESVKENAAPLQRGRNVSALERAAAASLGGRRAFHPKKDDFEERIDAFEQLVRPSEAPHVTEMQDDPLVHWLGYIKFYQENLPSDTHEQFLLMERCTRALVKMPQYANDDRFISVCAKYADKTKEPGQVFKYLYQQDIGGQTALFWAAWAYVAEKDNDYPFAEQIYKKGISKAAQPMDILKVRQKQFQRRMSRHWLNSSQPNDQIDELDEEDESVSQSRGALGGLSLDRVRRNDRSSRLTPLISQPSRVPNRRGAGHRSARNTSNTNIVGLANNGSFSIHVESEGENAPTNFLDQPAVENKRVIERDSDRRKENTLDAERWNKRGGLNATAAQSSSSSFVSRPAHIRSNSRGAPPPFPVFVDEECASRHEMEEIHQISEAQRHRRARDERTFRDRGGEGLAERLSRDPLRYVRDHGKFDLDFSAGKEHEELAHKQLDNEINKAQNEQSNKRGRAGFNKRLLKDHQGVEQSFEEARAKSKCYKLAPPSANFNLMKACTKADQSSQMDLDDGESLEVSMPCSSTTSQDSQSGEKPLKVQRLNSRPEGRVLFRPDASFESSVNRTAVSTASSALNEADAVGVPTKREEETINTKLAVRELSMMFSSPAFGMDHDARRCDRRSSPQNDSQSEEERGQEVFFANVGDGVGHLILDNSILNVDDNDTENAGPRNPYARSTNTPGFESMALREIKSTTDPDGTLGCQSSVSRLVAYHPQQNLLQDSEIDLVDEPGFQVYEDENPSSMPVVSMLFGVHEDGTSEEETTGNASSRAGGQGFQIFQDFAEAEKLSGGSRFPIFEEGEESKTIDDTESDTSDLYAQGNTATFSMLGNSVGLDDKEGTTSSPGRSPGAGQSEQGDTATFSVFNELFQDSSSANDRSVLQTSVSRKTSGGFSVFVDGEDEVDESRDPVIPILSHRKDTNARKSESNYDGDAVDYDSTYEYCIKRALRRLQASSSVAADSRSPLLSLLTVRGKSFHLPHIPLPREFRSKHLSGNTKVQIGKHSGIINCELGRGGYGVVALMDVHDGEGLGAETIALKAQSPTDSLAWECEVLRRLEDRMRPHSGEYVFPRPLSFISLADGGIFGMTAASKTGLNLVDLVNVYRVKLGQHVPEIITLYYVSRMLRHVEQLHWHGKILHCDVKPDNFVLSTLVCVDNSFSDIEFSDLMLVDFGRAVDLQDYSGDGEAARSVMFRGDACQDDMKCVAMREGKSWSYDIDTFGVLACAHVLLFGTHIKLRKVKGDRWIIADSFKRYWQKDIWTKVFGSLLNLDEESGAAIGSRARSLRSLREDIDAYIEKDSDKLRSFLSRQVTLLPSSRDQLE